MKVRDTKHVADFYDLHPTFPNHCKLHKYDTNGFVADLSRTLSQTSRHVGMVCVHDLPREEVSVKVDAIEFGLQAMNLAA